jgi:hypothetical protein
MNRKKFINLLSEEINNRLSSDSIITVVDFQNFFVIKGETVSSDVINLKDCFNKICENNKEYKNINFNTIDLIEYGVKPSLDKVVEIEIDPEKVYVPLDNNILLSEFQYNRSKNLGRLIYYYCKMIFDLCRSNFKMSRINFWFEFNQSENTYSLVSIKTDSYYNDNKLLSIILDNFDFNLVEFDSKISEISNLDSYNWSSEKDNLMLDVF